MKILGIDEAGRGPVVGPMVFCGAMLEKNDFSKIENIGIKDSKLLSKKKRDELYIIIKKTIKNLEVISITPKEIDTCLNSSNSNLNWLEADATIKIINKLKPDKAIIDCPSTNINSYKSYIFQRVNNKNIELIVEHKADMNYIIVGAGSIIAKVRRDEEIKKIEEKLKLKIGSGYPSDPYTKKFLEKYWKIHKDVFRNSWASYKKYVQESKQSKLDFF